MKTKFLWIPCLWTLFAACHQKEQIVHPQLKRLTHFPQTHHDIDADYSPDGTKIVFASDRLSSDGSLDLFVMNADGSNIQRIATGNCMTPNWGPKGPRKNNSTFVA